MLSCSCGDFEDDWWYLGPNDFITLNTTKRKRCCSCKELIDIGSVCVELERYRDPLTDIEERICGDEVELAPWYLCEWCGEMYFNFESLGYCYLAGDNLKENLKEYWELTGFVPEGE